MSFGETTWVDRHMTDAWSRIADHVPADWMPQVQSSTPKRTSVREYGCGHYGCVMPTGVEGLVCKLTSDVSEAKFVAASLAMDEEVTGIVNYKKIFALRGQQHRGRPVFVLWRDEAWDVGFLRNLPVYMMGPGGPPSHTQMAEKYNIMPGQIRSLREGEKYLDDFLTTARDVRDKLTNIFKKVSREEALEAADAAFERYRYDDPAERNVKHYRGIERVGVGLARCAYLAEMMANTDVIYPVGSALEYYLDNGLLMADVHLGNIGLDEERHLIITDPGHVIAVNPRWASWPQVEVV
jgi:hypothetical protein